MASQCTSCSPECPEVHAMSMPEIRVLPSSSKSSQSLRAKLISAAKEMNRERTQSGYVGTTSPCPRDLIEQICASIGESGAHGRSPITMCDLGCGDGRWLDVFSSRYWIVVIHCSKNNIPTRRKVALNEAKMVLCASFKTDLFP